MTPPNEALPSTPLKVGESGILKKDINYAIGLYVLDALIADQLGILSCIVAISCSFCVICSILWRLIKRTPIPQVLFFKMGIFWVCFAAVLSTCLINNKIAQSRAETIVTAVKQYKTKYKHYPDSLHNLVPEFLPSVPFAKYTLTTNSFWYHRYWYISEPWNYWSKDPGKIIDPTTKREVIPIENASFMYIQIAPFGRPSYYFESNRWGYLD